ncbi:MAG: glycosyltransferase [Nanoarchaeota archaeon]
MISLILCSHELDALKKCKEVIEKTIGVPHEFIVLDNQKNQYSLAQAYNLGAQRAQYNYLVFVHEDVTFLTQNWGSVLIKLFDRVDVGAVGLAGTTCLTEGNWCSLGMPYTYGRVIHDDDSGSFLSKFSEEKGPHEVVALDGLFLACRKEIIQEIPFDEQTFDGFHLYDLDWSLRVAQRHKVLVMTDILVLHTGGSYDEAWQNYKKKFEQKHHDLLPYPSKPDPVVIRKRWKTYPFDVKTLQEKKMSKVLVGCPTSSHKKYCLAQYWAGLQNLDYPNMDVVLVDNDLDDAYAEVLRKNGFTVLKGPYLPNVIERIAVSRNILREKALKEGYDYLFSLEQDVVPSPDTLYRLVHHQKDIITGVVLNQTVSPDGKKLLTVPMLWEDYPGEPEKMRYVEGKKLLQPNLFEVRACSLACTLISRKALSISFRASLESFDDILFCQDARKQGFAVFADPLIRPRHYTQPWDEATRKSENKGLSS